MTSGNLVKGGGGWEYRALSTAFSDWRPYLLYLDLSWGCNLEDYNPMLEYEIIRLPMQRVKPCELFQVHDKVVIVVGMLVYPTGRS